MKRFNLSEWALAHRGLVLYFMIATAILGAFAYTQLGQSEDPPYTFKVMVIRTDWPGATAREVEREGHRAHREASCRRLEGLETSAATRGRACRWCS